MILDSDAFDVGGMREAQWQNKLDRIEREGDAELEKDISAHNDDMARQHLISQMGDAIEERDVTIAKLQAVVDAVCWSRTPKKQAAVYRYRATLEEGTGVCYSEGIADALEKLAEEDK